MTANESKQAGQARLDGMVAALTSIAANTCCDRCQEAALVARDALRALPPQQETKRGFTSCIFIGDPPAPHISWHDWANADNYCDVTIMANKALPPTDGTAK